MRIQNIQTITYLNKSVKKKQKQQILNSSKKVLEPTFKAQGSGTITGMGGGLATGLLLIYGAAISGIVVLPALLGSIAVVSTGIAGAAIGHKIEKKIDDVKKDK